VYPQQPQDQAGVERIVHMTPGLVNMRELIPKGNGRWTMFVNAILNIMASNHYLGKPADLNKSA
jgi:hypothetical protein